MQIAFMDKGAGWMADLTRPIDISLPVRFSGPRLRAYGAPAAAAAPYQAGSFIGSVAAGGSCNCDITTFGAHLHGTHTECIGHISKTPVHVSDVLRDSFMLARLVTVAPAQADGCGEECGPAMQPGDTVITRAALEARLPEGENATALIIRTAPNGADKKTRDYGAAGGWPYFTAAAMELVAARDVRHLLVDTPSVDREEDAGLLAAHRIFWRDEARTITELVYAPDAVADGLYLLNLQLGAVASDAAPSRPLLYMLEDE
jgi:kynurenine formamidase